MAIVISGVGFLVAMQKKVNRLDNKIKHNYSMHLSELDGSLFNINLGLKKALYASSATQFSVLAAELSAETTVAKNSLSQLPNMDSEMSSVNKFLSQVGDYTLYLSKKIISGNDITDDERENLHSLSINAGVLSESLADVRAKYDETGMWVNDLSADLESNTDGTFDENLLELEELLSDYPTLIYDGPFSDHMLQGEVKMLEGKEEITEQKALEIAAKSLNIETSALKRSDDLEGKIPSYCFKSENDVTITVSKQGGYIVNMRKYKTYGEQKIEYSEAVEIATEYINSFSGTNFVSTYYFADEGVCTVNFAHKEGATVCYPDLIKVGVSLETKEIVFIEAAGYLANHYVRSIPTPKYSSADAKATLSKALEVKSVSRAIIPTDGNSEKHCYEFTCRGIDGEELLVYVNVTNLEEERILVLLKTDGGTLVK
jgi:germination protein YpeB